MTRPLILLEQNQSPQGEQYVFFFEKSEKLTFLAGGSLPRPYSTCTNSVFWQSEANLPGGSLFRLTNPYQLFILSINRQGGGDDVLILIDNKSGAPIYDQIFTQIKGHIIGGELKTDDPLPSIRALAKDLRISVITTKRAYDELERSGFIYTIPGKGSFVSAKNTELMREEHLKQMEEHMTAIRSLARLTGLSREAVEEMWSIMWEELE